MNLTREDLQIRVDTYAGFLLILRTITNLDFSASPVGKPADKGNWPDFGSWPMNDSRRF